MKDERKPSPSDFLGGIHTWRDDVLCAICGRPLNTFEQTYWLEEDWQSNGVAALTCSPDHHLLRLERYLNTVEEAL